MSDYYTPTGNPVAQSRGTSATQRSEFTSIQTGFDKLPAPASVWGNKAHYGVDTGIADAYLVTVSATYLTSYTDGMCVKVKALNANTGAATINVNSLGVKTIVRPDGTALQANDIVSGQAFEITYNATSGKFQLMNAYGGPAGPTGTLAGNATAGVNFLQGPNIASATTMDIWTGSQGNEMVVTGTTATTSFSAAPQAGASRVLIANGAWPITHGANLILPGSASYTCSAGDIITVHAITTTQFRCEITKADGKPVVSAGWVYLDSKTAAGSTSLDFAASINSTYDEYVFEMVNIVPATNAVALYLRTSTDGGSSYAAGGSDYSYGSIYQTAGTVSAVQSAAAAQIQIADTISNTASHGGVSGQLRIYSPSDATAQKRVMFETSSTDAGSTIFNYRGSGMRLATADVDAVRFIMSSGNITSGTIRMYGVRKS